MKIAVFDSQWSYTVDTPYTEALGGTQSAICYFCEEMATKKNEVYLFNKVKYVTKSRNVSHIPAQSYKEYILINNLEFDIIIVSCLPNDLFEIKNNLNNTKTLYCLWTGHDIDQVPSLLLKDTKCKDMVDLFIFVSNWQRLRYIEKYSISFDKTLIMRNGIGKSFEKYLDLPTNKITNSMTYCSIPWRGLELLIPIFKEVKKHISNISLNIYSGMNIYKQEETNTTLKQYEEFKTMESVNYNYGVSQTKLAEELYKIEYLTYPNIFQETSCITALQAMACGCLVVTSDLGALKETMNNLNEYVDINIYNFDINKYALDFINKLFGYINLSENIKEMLRNKNKQHIKDNYLWSVITDKFESDINTILQEHNKYISSDYKLLLRDSIYNYSNEKWQESLELLNKITYFPNMNEYYVVKLNTGVTYFKLGNFNLAKSHFKTCKSIKNDFNINKNIALLELQRNDINKFLKYGRQALNLEFDTIFATLLAEKLEILGYYTEAIGVYRCIIDLEPNNIICLNNLGNIYLLLIASLDDIDTNINKTYGKSLEICHLTNQNRKKELVLSNIIFNNLYNWNLSEEEIFKRSSVWYQFFPKDQRLMDIVMKLDKTKYNKKLRIGYISTDFITHPVGFMFDSIIKNHNLDLFDIYCYDNSVLRNKSSPDTTSQKLRSYNKAKWCQITDLSDEEVLTIMINDNLDILVDMMGHTRNTRMNLLQYKSARKVISYFAYPATNGLKEIDYRFTDKYATPPQTQKYFVEKLYYLPNGFQCYTPPAIIDGTKNYIRDSTYPIHLCCFNNPTKLSIPTIDTFCEILKRLPTSKLYLRYCYYKSSFYKETIMKLFTDRGIIKERIDIGFEHLLDALKMYNNIDIALDPFPYNGGTISSECIYMNTPFITLAGKSYVSRVGVSLLSNLGLEKYIASTKEEYINKVIDLANNKSELKELHQTLRLRMLNSDLANSVTFTKNIEKAYIDIAK